MGTVHNPLNCEREAVEGPAEKQEKGDKAEKRKGTMNSQSRMALTPDRLANAESPLPVVLF